MKASLLAVILTIAVAAQAQAAEKTSAIYGPKCDTAKVKELLGDKASKVEASAAAGIHNVTYDDALDAEVTEIVVKNCM